ncbi:DUF3558 family protein [Streptomyces sp. MN03-5084-2B]|nr:DUF3558 family protein [Streptomyces sp. MN03-5084-2B]
MALAAGLTGCTSEVGGQATPSSQAAGTTPPVTGDPDNPFAALSPCTILDQVLAGQGFPPATPTLADSKHGCGTEKPSSVAEQGLDVALILQPGGDYKNNVNNPGQASEGKVNGRPAIEEQEPQHSPGQCSIRFQVKQNSRALLVLSSALDTASACKQVEGIAAKVEPLLPKN